PPPIPKPKYRPPAIPPAPGSAASTSSRSTCSGSRGVSGSGPPSAARSSSAPALASTGRVPSDSRKSAAYAAVRVKSSRLLIRPTLALRLQLADERAAPDHALGRAAGALAQPPVGRHEPVGLSGG